MHASIFAIFFTLEVWLHRWSAMLARIAKTMRIGIDEIYPTPVYFYRALFVCAKEGVFNEK
ncbi:MAG: hypothetical protein Q7R66_09115 [Undibacterium sp.]|uniref:hypothetical protein n=1 Tax=Undibacterium sp. TaxID=1914977 RepID=UPI002725BA9F|nr:hypothetical protein [Undibacterium sp.]MDO8652335.1 hypothetical protein [Undibacterium sp.]